MNARGPPRKRKSPPVTPNCADVHYGAPRFASAIGSGIPRGPSRDPREKQVSPVCLYYRNPTNNQSSPTRRRARETLFFDVVRETSCARESYEVTHSCARRERLRYVESSEPIRQAKNQKRFVRVAFVLCPCRVLISQIVGTTPKSQTTVLMNPIVPSALLLRDMPLRLWYLVRFPR